MIDPTEYPIEYQRLLDEISREAKYSSVVYLDGVDVEIRFDHDIKQFRLATDPLDPNRGSVYSKESLIRFIYERHTTEGDVSFHCSRYHARIVGETDIDRIDYWEIPETGKDVDQIWHSEFSFPDDTDPEWVPFSASMMDAIRTTQSGSMARLDSDYPPSSNTRDWTHVVFIPSNDPPYAPPVMTVNRWHFFKFSDGEDVLAKLVHPRLLARCYGPITSD